jgi:dihydrofolate reductase
MRKLIVTNIVSLDGYYDGPGGDVMAMPMDERFDEYNATRLAAADTLLLGRNSYEGFKGYWPTVKDDPEASEHNREISRLENAIDKIVISDTLSEDETEPWTDTTEIVRRADAHERIRELKQGDGREILMFASRTLWNELLQARLVDELHFMVGGLALGGGTPAFAGAAPEPFRLLGVETWDDSDNHLVRYATGGARPLRKNEPAG